MTVLGICEVGAHLGEPAFIAAEGPRIFLCEACLHVPVLEAMKTAGPVKIRIAKAWAHFLSLA